MQAPEANQLHHVQGKEPGRESECEREESRAGETVVCEQDRDGKSEPQEQ